MTADDEATLNRTMNWREEAGLTAYSCWDLLERASSAKLLEMACGAMHAACCTCCLARSPLRASRRNIPPLSLSLPLSHHLLQPRPTPLPLHVRICVLNSVRNDSDVRTLLGAKTSRVTPAGHAKRVRIWSSWRPNLRIRLGAWECKVSSDCCCYSSTDIKAGWWGVVCSSAARGCRVPARAQELLCQWAEQQGWMCLQGQVCRVWAWWAPRPAWPKSTRTTASASLLLSSLWMKATLSHR